MTGRARELNDFMNDTDFMNDIDWPWLMEDALRAHLCRRCKRAYAHDMRSWPGFEAPAHGPCDHVIRYLPRDYAIFRRMQPGDQYPEAHQVAVHMLREAIEEEARKGRVIRPDTDAYEQLRSEIVPPVKMASSSGWAWTNTTVAACPGVSAGGAGTEAGEAGGRFTPDSVAPGRPGSERRVRSRA